MMDFGPQTENQEANKTKLYFLKFVDSKKNTE